MSLRESIRHAALAACILAAPAMARDLVVGQVVEYSGKHGEASRDYVAGARVYFDWLNKQGGLNGGKIRHTVLDATDGNVRARTRELLDERKVDVLFGYVGDEAVESAAQEPEIRAERVALVGPLAGREAPPDAGAIHFTRPGYDAEIRLILAHFQALNITRFAVLRTPTEQGRLAAQTFERLLGRDNLRLAGARTLASAEASTPADVEAVLGMNAQALVVVADTIPAAEFIKRYRPRDPGAMVVALSTTNHRAMFELLGPRLAHGVMITQVVPNPNIAESPLLKEHLDAIRMFRDEPPSHLTLEGFIAAKALVEGLRRAGPNPTRASIATALRGIRRLDLKGLVVDLSREGRSESPYVDIAMIRRNGALLQ